MAGLHRFLDDGYQLLAQGVQVHLLAQRGTEGRYNLGRIVLAAIEAAIDESLQTLAQGSEERRNGQRRGHDDDG